MLTRIDHITLCPGTEGESPIPFVKNAEVQIDGNRIVYAGEAAHGCKELSLNLFFGILPAVWFITAWIEIVFSR